VILYTLTAQAGTTFGGTRLDVDTSIEVVLETAAQTFLSSLLRRCLSKHKNVAVVIMARGNHDSDTAIALASDSEVLLLKRAKSKRS
jgi:metallophosphoesterase superfamily enzyme